MGQLILHLADLHLGYRHGYLEAGAAARAREADLVLDRIADWLAGPAAGEVAALLIAGDLFDDPRPDAALVARVIRALRAILDAGVAIVTVPGNHDEWTYPDGVFRREAASWPGVLVTGSEPAPVATIDVGSLHVEVVSCAFQQGRNPPSSRWTNPFGTTRESGTRRIGLFHGTCDRIGGLVAEGERAFRLELDRMAGWGLDYIALGHIHKRQEFLCGSCLALYPGPIEGRSFKDPGSPLLSLVDLSGEVARVQTRDALQLGIRTREVAVLALDSIGLADPSQLEQEIRAAAERAGAAMILKVVLRGKPAFAIQREEILRRLAPHFYHLEIEAEEPVCELGDWESLASQRTLEGIFTRKILESRGEATTPEETRFWNDVAAAGLRGLGRGRS